MSKFTVLQVQVTPSGSAAVLRLYIAKPKFQFGEVYSPHCFDGLRKTL